VGRLLLIVIALAVAVEASASSSANRYKPQNNNRGGCPLYPIAKEPPPKKDEPKSPDEPTRTPTLPKTTEGSGNVDVPRAADLVAWSSTPADAEAAVKESKGYYALFFCDAKTAEVAGEGSAAWEQFKKTNRGAASPTVFDSTVMIAEFEAAGITSFAKVPANEQNRPLWLKYNAAPPTVVICNSAGKAIRAFAGADCKQTQIVKYLQTSFKADKEKK
jgi:hypothetical protein